MASATSPLDRAASVLGWALTVAGYVAGGAIGLVTLYLVLSLLHAGLGLLGVIAGIILLPLAWVLVPLYAALWLGWWTPILGVIATVLCTLVLGGGGMALRNRSDARG